MAQEQVNQNEVNETPVSESTIDNTADNNAETKAEEIVETVETVKAYWNDKYARLAAEFDNFRKRTNKELSDVIKNGGKEVIMPLLEVMDDYDRAKDQLEKADNVAALREGVNLVFGKLASTLKGKGLEEMTSTGEDFNADFHEAIAEIPAPTPELADKVIDTVQKGYLLNGKIIRHAKVVVGKA